MLPTRYALVHYAARQSWVSAASPPLAKPENIQLGPFSTRSLIGDFTSNVPMLLRELGKKSDVILIDIATDRHGVYPVGNSFISNTSELKRSNLLSQRRIARPAKQDVSNKLDRLLSCVLRKLNLSIGSESSFSNRVLRKHSNSLAPLRRGQLIKFGSPEHKKLFGEAVAKLSRIMKRAGVLDRAIVLYVQFAGESNNGEEVPLARGMTADEMNAHYEYYYRVLERYGFTLTPAPPSELVIANSQHKWGLQQDHFIDEMYLWWADRIDEFANRNAFKSK